MSASIWTPGSTNVPVANPNSQITREDFTATAGQTDFILTLFTYAIGANALEVFVNGSKQSGDIITELSTSSFRIVGGVEAGDYVEVIGNTESVDAEGAAVAAAASAAAALASQNAASASEAAALGSKNTAVAAAAAASLSESNIAGAITAERTAVATLTNKSVDLANNTLTGTLAQFNAACSDAEFVSQAGTETLTNKTVLAATNTIEARSGPDSSAFSDRNVIIGGDFSTNPWQRGTSGAAADGAYLADRFKMGWVNDGAATVSKTADAPTTVQAGVFTQHCWHLDVTTADAALAAGQYAMLVQAVEGLNALRFGLGQAGTRYVTLSFWHKHTKVGTYCVSLSNATGTRSYVAEYEQDVSDTWEKAIIVVPVDVAGTWLYDTGAGVNVRFCFGSGATFQTTANAWQAGNFLATANQVNALDNVANNCKIALVQLEAGQTVTPFESLSAGGVLRLCQRYCFAKLGAGAYCVGQALSSTSVFAHVEFPATMRSAPTLEVASNIVAATQSGAQVSATTVVIANATPYSAHLSLTMASASFTAGDASLVLGSAAGSGFRLSAEL